MEKNEWGHIVALILGVRVCYFVSVCVVFFLIDVSFCVEVRDQSNEKYLIAYGRLTVHYRKK